MLNPVSVALGIVSKVADIGDKYIVDKDAKIQMEGHLSQLREQVYITELSTRTIPWVDALHKMGRQIISLVTLLGTGALIYFQPDLDPLTLMAMTGPAGVYNYVKGRGK